MVFRNDASQMALQFELANQRLSHIFDRSVDSHREIHAKNVQGKTYWKGKIFGQRFGKQFGK